jgi:hypothetical protein
MAVPVAVRRVHKGEKLRCKATKLPIRLEAAPAAAEIALTVTRSGFPAAIDGVEIKINKRKM